MVFGASTSGLVTGLIAAAGALISAVLIAFATIRSRSYDDLVEELCQRIGEEFRKANRQQLADIQRELDLQKRYRYGSNDNST